MCWLKEVSGYGLAPACLNLSRFVMGQAQERRQQLGFAWTPSARHPVHFDQARQAVSSAYEHHGLYPVPAARRENGIYNSRFTDQAYSFWHDTNHVMLDKGFCVDDELAVARAQLKALDAAGYHDQTIEHRLFEADTVGQMECYISNGRFPRSRLAFSALAVGKGIQSAVKQERMIQS